jgi:arsenate reductase
VSGGSTWQDDAEAIRAAQPRHVLFLCVANSARSQMAEGIARALAPASIRISSAGSQPSRVNPLAVKALAEVGIDITGQYSKSVNDIAADDVDAVVTLCAEEVCPVFLGSALRVHWGLLDPAQASGSDADRLQAFRDARDELRRRLAKVFPQPDSAAVRYRRASREDLGAVRALLVRLHLPAEDLGNSSQTFVIAHVGDELVGCVALERCGEDALLRSLAVIPRMQSTGLGKALHAKALAEAEQSGTRAVYLLTTTAAPFFARAGFTMVDRADVPVAVRASQEFRSLCPASAVCMERRLR